MSATAKTVEELPKSAQIHFVQTTLEKELSGKYSSAKERNENLRTAIEVCKRWRAHSLAKGAV